MSKIDDLIEKLCPNGVEYKPIWSLTAWDKKFKGVDKEKQKKIISYKYYLSTDFAKAERKNGNIKYISTGISGDDRYTTEELAGDYLADGEVVCIPWGGTPNVKYHKGKFVTGDNRIATSLDVNILSNKFLYYWMQSRINVISKFYRGSGIKHPSMKDVLDMNIAVPPLEVQCEIVHILDDFTLLSALLSTELSAELKARQKQFTYFEEKLLFNNNFKKVKLADLCIVNQGLQIPINQRKKTPAENRYFYITVQFLKGGDEKYYIENPQPNVICKKEDILVTRTGSTGKIITGVEGCFHNNFFKVEPNERILKRYLYFVLNSKRMYNKMLRAASGGTVPDLPHRKFYNLEIFLPSIDEQKKIINVLERFEKLRNDISEGLPAEIEARQKQYEYYREKLLTFKELKVNE